VYVRKRVFSKGWRRERKEMRREEEEKKEIGQTRGESSTKGGAAVTSKRNAIHTTIPRRLVAML
jgi:hypothetical protein